METKNTIRKKIWRQQTKSFREKAIINIDGKIAETYGECKEGMDISYSSRSRAIIALTLADSEKHC